MSKSNRGIFIAGIGIFGFAFGLIIAPLFYAQQYHEKAVAAQQRGAPANNRPQQSDSERAGIPGFLQTQISNPEPAGESEKDKRDLAAQEAAAVGSLWSAMIGFAGLLVTALGTGLLYQQIGFTRKALAETGEATQAMKEANEIAKSAVDSRRPWLIPSKPTIQSSQDKSILAFVSPWKNWGEVPALRTDTGVNHSVFPVGTPIEEVGVRPLAKRNVPVGTAFAPGQEMSSGRRFLTAEETKLFKQGEVFVAFLGTSWYFGVADAPDAPPKITTAMFLIYNASGPTSEVPEIEGQILFVEAT